LRVRRASYKFHELDSNLAKLSILGAALLRPNFGTYIRAIRPLDSLGYVVVALIGAGSFLLVPGITAGQLLLETFLICEALMSSVFLLNNRFDYIADRRAGLKKTSKNPIASGLMSYRQAEALSLILMLLGLLALSAWSHGATSILSYIVAWVIGLTYSAPPFRFKSRAGLDVLSHGAVVVALFLLGYSLANTFSWISLTFGIPFFMLSTIYELRNHLKDWASDSSAGVHTVVDSFGVDVSRRLLWLAIILFWLSALFAGYFLGEGLTVLVAATIASYAVSLVVIHSRTDLLFDLHLWMMGGVYSAYRLLILAGLLKLSVL
jgi:4-hydroxybenzoate polyprenyltransferase